MEWWRRWRSARDDGEAAGETALYGAVVARARDPDWYLAGGVADTIDGRFAMVATVLAFVLLRLEREADRAAATARLTELFIDDMDGQLRQIGIGDIVVGKHMGKMMALLGGRLGAYRDGLANGELAPAVRRNLYVEATPDETAVVHAATRLQDLATALDATPAGQLLAGRLP